MKETQIKEPKFNIRVIPDEISTAARNTNKSPQYGHPAHVEIAGGTGPCRQCLRTFDVGKENRILFTYNPFAGLDPYPSPGPIFVHETPCATYSPRDKFPDTLRSLPLVFEGYGSDRWVTAREKVIDGAAEAAIARIFDQPGSSTSTFATERQAVSSPTLTARKHPVHNLALPEIAAAPPQRPLISVRNRVLHSR